LEEAPAAVVFGEGGGVVLVGRHPDPHGIRTIVLAPLQPPPAPVVRAFPRGAGPGDGTLPDTTGRTSVRRSAPPTARGKLVVEHGVEAHVLGGQDAVEGLGLGHGAREAFNDGPEVLKHIEMSLDLARRQWLEEKETGRP